MTTTDDILTAARKRLDAITAERAALDAEEAKLRRMLAAAEQPEPAKLVPLPVAPPIQPLPVPWPIIVPQPVLPSFPDPLTPWWAQPGVTSTWCGPVDAHGRPLPCGSGAVFADSGMTLADGVTWLETGLAGATVPPDALLSNGVRGDTLWRQNGVSDLTGQPYYVGTPLLVDAAMRPVGAADVMGVSLDERYGLS